MSSQSIWVAGFHRPLSASRVFTTLLTTSVAGMAVFSPSHAKRDRLSPAAKADLSPV